MDRTAGTQTLTIKQLSDDDTLALLVTWFEQTWAPYYGETGPGDAAADLRAALEGDPLPVCLVAYDSSRSPVGTVSLKTSSISHDELGPWITAMLIPQRWRDRGIGGRLLQAATREARRLGFKSLYVSGGGEEMDVSNRELSNAGWCCFDNAESLRGTVSVFKLALSCAGAGPDPQST